MSINQKQRLFNELSNNLSFYKNNELKSQILCPLCLNLFNSIEDLSKAHILPKAFGGRDFTIACMRCNNSIGSYVEGYETERVKYERSFQGDGRSFWKAGLSIPEDQHLGKVITEMTIIEDGQKTTWNFKPIIKASSPKALEKIVKLWGEAGSSINIETQVRGGWNRAKLTYLHAAYLFLFSQLGYEWVLDPHVQVIRKQILRPEEELIPFQLLSLNGFELNSCIENQVSCYWYMVIAPIEAIGFLIAFSGLQHWNSPVGVWMPFPGCLYKQIPEIYSFRVELLKRIPENYLSNSKSRYLGSKLLFQRFFEGFSA